MTWRLLAWGLIGCVALAVGFLIWPPSEPSLAIEIRQRGGKAQLVRDETLLVGAILDGEQFGDADATKLARVSSIRSVSWCSFHLRQTDATRAGCERLKKLCPNLNVRLYDPGSSVWVKFE